MEGKHTKARDRGSSLRLNAQGAGSPRIFPANRRERIKEGGNECVKDKLDQHMLSFAGRHTLESQEGRHYLARVSNLPGLPGFAPCLLRKGGRKGGRGGRQRAKGARVSQGACTQAMAQCPPHLPLVSAWLPPRTPPLV